MSDDVKKALTEAKILLAQSYIALKETLNKELVAEIDKFLDEQKDK